MYQHWWHQTITWSSVDQGTWRDMAPQGLNEFTLLRVMTTHII